jgi:hypothetical protein
MYPPPNNQHQIPKTGLYLEMKMLHVTERRKNVRFAYERTLAKLFGNLPLLLRRRLHCVRVSERATCAAGLLCCNDEEEEGESRAERQTRLALRRRVELAQRGVWVSEHTRRQRKRQLVGAVFKK